MKAKITLITVGLLTAAMVMGTVQPASAAKRRTRSTTVSTLRPVGAPILSDSQAAGLVRHSAWEPRPKNTTANNTVPSATQLATFDSYKGQWGNCDNLRDKVTGNFKGTTDEITQWAAWKWGLPENVLRAAAVTETYWKMSFVGDNGQSFGLFQIKNVSKWHGGTYPLSKDSSAFNADYYAGMVRHYFEGCATWMKDYSYNGTSYAAGDLWGSVGAWYSGNWHSNAANNYITSVKKHRKNKTWTTASFLRAA